MIGGAVLALYSCLITLAILIIYGTDYAKVSFLVTMSFAGLFVTGITMHVFKPK